MGESLSSTESVPTPREDRLDSWKEIAAYFNRDVTTVQRWEKREGMPVHRHLHDRMGSVYASRAELEAWNRSRKPPATAEAQTAHKRSPFVLVLAALVAALTIAGAWWLHATEFFWRSPIVDAKFQRVTDFDGFEQAATMSRDGRFVAFLSSRDGPMDVWVTQVGSGRFYNLTRGSAPELVNPSVRTLGFSPDGTMVMFWARKSENSNAGAIGIWAVPTLGGQAHPLLEGVAEADWSSDGSRLAYHTPEPGDPMFVTDAGRQSESRRIFAAPAGRHAHFPLWSPDGRLIYFVEGSLPDQMDIWRVSADGGPAERITSQNGRLSHPVLLNRRTLVYLASDPDGSGPWLHSVDVERRRVHRLSAGADRFTSLAASADGRHLVATIAGRRRTLWRVPLADAPVDVPAVRIPLTTSTGFSPRLGPDYLLYVSDSGASQSIWKLVAGVATELWTGAGAQIFGGPAVTADGQRIAFSVRQRGRTLLYVMQPDGTNARIVSESLDLQGAPAWAPGGQSITSAALVGGTPRLFRIPVDRSQPSTLVDEYATDPAWAPDGEFVVYSGPDIGATFSLKAATRTKLARPLPALTLTRGARRLAFLPGGRRLLLLRGEIQRKNLWLVDLDTGAERQLTTFAPDFEVQDFDVSSDGREVVVERVQEDSDIVVLNLPTP